MWRSKHDRQEEPSEVWGWVWTILGGTVAAVLCWVVLVMAMVM